MHFIKYAVWLGSFAAAGVGLAVSLAVQLASDSAAVAALETADPPRPVLTATARVVAEPAPPAMLAAAIAPPQPAPYHPEVAQQFERIEQTLRELERSQASQRDNVNDALNLMKLAPFGQALLQANQPASAAPPTEEPPAAVLPPAPAAEPLPSPERGPRNDIQRGARQGELVINIQNADIREVLDLLGQQAGLNILASRSVQGAVSATLNNVDVEDALAAILKTHGYAQRREGRFVYVGTPQDFVAMDHAAQRVQTRVYRPNYVSAQEVQGLITGLLTEGVGMVTVSRAAEVGIQPDSNMAGGNSFGGEDVVVVRDYEPVLAQVDLLFREIDRRPRQVSIEAMILSVDLGDTNKLGVDFAVLRNNLVLASGTPLASLANLPFDGGLKAAYFDGDLGVFIEALESVGETSVVAKPRLLCLNKQRAEILIGAQLGYVSTTVTENAATQSVEFLEIGTQLRLRPFISSDGMIRMEVHPELSTGTVRVEQNFTLPDKEVTQVTTNIMCPDGCTVVIGGLIREDLNHTRSQIPVLGSLPGVGALFRRTTEKTDRRELIVLITPRIVADPDTCCEGAETSALMHTQHRNFFDKMSPLGKRHYAEQYLRRARAAWAAGDAEAALRLVNLSIHFDASNLAATALREEVAATGVGDPSIRMHLTEGLAPWGHPLRDYSRQGYPWQTPPPGAQGYHAPLAPYDPGVPGSSLNLDPPPTWEEIAP